MLEFISISLLIVSNIITLAILKKNKTVYDIDVEYYEKKLNELMELRAIYTQQEKLNNSLNKEIKELTEQIKTQKQALILYDRELKDYRTTKNCTSKLNLKS